MKTDQVGEGVGTGGCGICLFTQNAFRAGRIRDAKAQGCQEDESWSQPHLHRRTGQWTERWTVFGNGI